MANPKVDYFIDLILGISFAVSVFSGIVMYVIPWGSEQAVLGIIRSSWPTIHEWSSFIMAGLVLIHLALHFRWIGHMTKSIFCKSVTSKQE